MRLPSLHLERESVTPFLTVAFPSLWYAMREATVASPESTVVTTVGGLTLAIAVGVVVGRRLARVEPKSYPLSVLVRPSNRSLAALAVFLVGILGYFSWRAVVPIPSAVDAVLTPVGLAVGAPLLVCYVAVVALGNVFPVAQTIAFQWVAAVVGVVLTAWWLMVLADAAARVGGRLRGRLDSV